MKTKILLLSTLVLLAACKGKNDPKAELTDLKKQQADIASKIAALEAKPGMQDSTKSTDVSVVAVKAGSFTNYVQIQGRIDAQDNVTAYPQSAGTIIAINVKAGDHVSKGEVLAQLDNSVLKQNILQAQAQAELANTVYQRQKNLWDQKIGTEVQFLQAKTNMDATQKQVASLRQQADLARIISPINGTVDQMDLKLGQVASPGLTGIRIVNADILKVKADVPESYATRVSQGQTVKVLFPDAQDSLTAKVTFASKVIDQGSRSFGIEIKLPTNRNLRPNMTATLKIADYSKASVITVPLKAIQKSEDGDYVFVNENGVAKRKTIKQGTMYNSQAEILSGLKDGDQLIVMGASDIEDGDKVKVLAGN
ncbi:RND family efflux transporter MFP subunit [Mucilaginibacter gracilis]|uniref:RND family efflux transporter MFP subunit n=1 Tax=Mucilaginibacter gracilis TaxID=423350 RepID=A0A495J160_9SPHI|nr:efflux RND transporter periplasmic adaptor subunit [Mucilaginibacter gracilis]RKR82726.1 RND family efflux transporter MFP subunit [Mucilaginibacter gracilis]